MAKKKIQVQDERIMRNNVPTIAERRSILACAARVQHVLMLPFFSSKEKI